MDDACRVRGLERVRDLNSDLEDLRDWQRSRLQPVPKRRSLEPLHHQKRLPFVLGDVVEDADVGVTQDGRRTRLALEAFAGCVIIELTGGQKLERHPAAQPKVLRLVHDAHAALAEWGGDPVVGDGLANHGPLVHAALSGETAARTICSRIVAPCA
jgi:hypothetical protein